MSAKSRNVMTLLVAGLLVTAVLFALYRFEPYGELWELPVAVALAVLLTAWSRRRFPSPWLFSDALSLPVVLIRYWLGPVLLQLSGREDIGLAPAMGPEYYTDAIRYMVYELSWVTAVYVLGTYWVVRTRHEDNQRPIPATSGVQTLAVVGGLSLMLIPAVLHRFTFIASPIELTARELAATYTSSYDTLASVANLARIALPMVVLAWAYRKTQREPRFLYALIALAVCLLANAFYVSTSRASVLLPLAASFLTALVLFPKWRGAVSRLAIVALVVGTVVMTYRKSIEGSDSVDTAWVANYFSIYFLGPQEYAVGFLTRDLFAGDVTLSTLASDLLGNIPILSNLVDPADRTSQLFNWAYLRSDIGVGGGFIVPGSVQGMLHAGTLLGPVVTIVPIALLILLQRWMLKERLDATGTYILLFGMVICCVYYSNSISALMNMVAYLLVPLLVLNLVQRRWSRAWAREEYA